MKDGLEPLKFLPVYKDYIWGGRRLEAYGRVLPFEINAESWDLTCRENEMSIVSEGSYKGKTLKELLEKNPTAYLGEHPEWLENFPLLIKLIDANDDLSVQVHPDDAYAAAHENEPLGKSEMWYIMEAQPGSSLILGLKEETTKEEFERLIQENRVQECLHRLPVQKGDIVNIKPGTIHAITKGLLVCEIQQNSNITYRVDDFNRVAKDGSKRMLHIKQALEVTNFDSKQLGVLKGLSFVVPKDGKQNKLTYYIANPYFAVLMLEITEYTEHSNSKCFSTFTCVEGACRLEYTGGFMNLATGDTVFIPARLGEYSFKGNAKLLKSFVPDIEEDFCCPLLEQGYSRETIEECTDIGI